MIRTEVASLLLVLFALFSQPAQAIPVTYQIEYTLLDGGPKPLSTSFTFDPGTNLFANLRIVWIPASPASPTAVFFDCSATMCWATTSTISRPKPVCNTLPGFWMAELLIFEPQRLVSTPT